jgi:prevent-host-death family protein
MSSTQISVAQAKAEFAALVARAEAGEDIIVTRNGRPVARLTHLTAVPVSYGDLADLDIPDDLAAFDLPEEIIAGFDGCP